MEDQKLLIYTIFDQPKDFAASLFVVREWEISPAGHGNPMAGELVFADPDIEQCRQFLAKKLLTCLGRSPDDDVNIVESWI